MRWKRRRVLYLRECEAFARHVIEQHGKHIFVKSLLDEAPGLNLSEKLASLIHGDQEAVYQNLTRSTRHKLRRIREQTIVRALRWQRKRYPSMANDFVSRKVRKET